MTTTIPLLIELVDDVVLSDSAATAGEHASLDYIPGGALLGAAARRGYGDGEPAFRCFHSGRVRFSNGYAAVPRLDGTAERALPMPASAHYPKDEQRPPLAQLRNLAVDRAPANVQLVQERSGYITGDLARVVAPSKHYGMRTAFDAERGSAREAQLFGYEALGAGQRFVAMIEADAEADAEAMAGCLVGTIRLGRSRSAEFGAARVSRLVAGGHAGASGPPADDGGLRRIWALSDLCLHDRCGEVVLDPALADLGIGAFEVDWSRTFVRTRSYWPFNGHWRSRTEARAVIAKGSVITIRPGDAACHEAVGRLRHVGLHRAAGLGEIAVDPPLLAGATLSVWSAPSFVVPAGEAGAASRRSDPEASAYAGALGRWLDGRSGHAGRQAARERMIADVLGRLARAYGTAVRYQGRERQELVAPTKAQWHGVAERARTARDAAALVRGLFDAPDAICRPGDAQWSGSYDRDGQSCFRELLRGAVTGAGDDAPWLIAHIAREAADRVESWGHT